MNENDFLMTIMYPFAQAAYSVMNVPPPPLALPDGYAIVGIISANPQKAVGAMTAATPDQQRLANETVIESTNFGVVAYSATDSAAIVAIRGTANWKDWLSDIDAPLVPDRSVPSAGLVHMGFQAVYEHIRDSILDLLAAHCMGARKMYVTGHSLGGALAILCGMDLKSNSPVRVVPEVHSFAGPRVGDANFSRNVTAVLPVCSRVVNFMDVVPQVPLPPLYEHPGKEYLVKGGFRPLDVVYAHHLTTYLAGMQKLGPAAP